MTGFRAVETGSEDKKDKTPQNWGLLFITFTTHLPVRYFYNHVMKYIFVHMVKKQQTLTAKNGNAL